MKRKKLVLAGALGLGLLALAANGSAADDDDGLLARTEVVQRRDLFATVTGSGLVQPRRKIDVSADVPGRVVELAVQEGAWVEAGSLLLRIDASRQESALLRARAALAQAEATTQQVRGNLVQARSVLGRSEQLAGDRGWVTPAELDQLRSQAAALEAQLRASEFAVQQSRASVAEARDAVDKCTLRAPMSGRVTRLNVEVGETASTGSSSNPNSILLTIADPSRMEAAIRVDETDVPSIQVGDRATVRIDAFPRQAFPGRVVRVSNSASRGGGAQSAHFQVIIALDSTQVPLHPELSANAEVVTEERRGVLSIPILALTARDRTGHRPARAGADASPLSEGIFVVENGVARFVPVRVGIVGKRHFEVASGLRGGETVVAGNYQLVRELEDGDEVETAPAGPADVPDRS
jgi:HlyD family secretion protein